MIRLWDNAWAEFIPSLYLRDVEMRRVICSTNAIDSLNAQHRRAIESVNARHRRAIKARGHFPNEQSALKCLYLVTPITGPHRGRAGTTDHAVEASAQRVRDHRRRPLPGHRNLLTNTAGNTNLLNLGGVRGLQP